MVQKRLKCVPYREHAAAGQFGVSVHKKKSVTIILTHAVEQKKKKKNDPVTQPPLKQLLYVRMCAK